MSRHSTRRARRKFVLRVTDRKSNGAIIRREPHIPRPVEELAIIGPGGGLLQTKFSDCIGHFSRSGYIGYFVMRAPSGQVFLQREDLLHDEYEAKPLTPAQAVEFWNLCSVKRSADALLG